MTIKRIMPSNFISNVTVWSFCYIGRSWTPLFLKHNPAVHKKRFYQSSLPICNSYNWGMSTRWICQYQYKYLLHSIFVRQVIIYNIVSSHPLTSQVEIPTRPYKQQMLIVCNEWHSVTTNPIVKLTCNKQNTNLYTRCCHSPVYILPDSHNSNTHQYWYTRVHKVQHDYTH